MNRLDDFQEDLKKIDEKFWKKHNEEINYHNKNISKKYWVFEKIYGNYIKGIFK
jgi:hypothetical protein